MLKEGSDVPCIMCIQEKDGGLFGIAFAKASTSQFWISEFKDNSHYSNLESLLIQTGTREVLINEDENAKLKPIFERNNILVTHKNVKKYKDSVDWKAKLAKPVIVHHVFASTSIGCLFQYLEISEKIHLEEYSHLSFMRLDQTVIESFQLLSKAFQNSPTLYSILNYCQTKMGSRKLEEWIRRPLQSKEDIEKRQEIVQALIDDECGLTKIFSKMPDITTLVRRIAKRRASLKDIVMIYDFVKVVSKIHSAIESIDVLNEYTSIFKILAAQCEGLIELVEKMIDLSAVKNHKYRIKAEYSEALAAKEKEMKKIQGKLDLLKEKVELDLDVSVDIRTDDIVGMHFRVPRSKESSISSDYNILASNKTGTKFVNDKLISISKQETEISEQYDEIQEEMIRLLVDSVSSYNSVLEDASEVVACLDVLLSFAKASSKAEIPWICPKIVEKGIHLKGSRHPILESLKNTSIIPNDFDMEQNRFIVFTGANMSGKSTYMRQIGIVVIMAQIGCFVPCTEAKIAIRDAIYSRVGAIDYMQRGLSTFMVEMIETNQILNNATEQSLVIIDELGRGTSTFDGFGLAWAISEHIITKLKSYCIFATHFHELSTLSEKYQGIAYNLQLKHLKGKNQDNQDDLIMLHKVAPGVCDESFGLHVAELAKFPQKVIVVAKKRALELTNPTPTESKKMKQSDVDKLVKFCHMDIEKVSTTEFTQFMKK